MATPRRLAPRLAGVVAVVVLCGGCQPTMGTQVASPTPATQTSVPTTPTTAPATAVPTPTASPATGAPNDQSTWTMSLAETTCALWLGEMFPAQRLAAAAQLLTSARTTDGKAGPPTDGLVAGFEADVTTECTGDEPLTVAMAADAVYAGTGHDRYSG